MPGDPSHSVRTPCIAPLAAVCVVPLVGLQNPVASLPGAQHLLVPPFKCREHGLTHNLSLWPCPGHPQFRLDFTCIWLPCCFLVDSLHQWRLNNTVQEPPSQPLPALAVARLPRHVGSFPCWFPLWFHGGCCCCCCQRRGSTEGHAGGLSRVALLNSRLAGDWQALSLLA